MNKSILVIGGTGTTGKSLLEILKNQQANYKAMVRSAEKQAALEAEGIPAVKASLGEWEGVDQALRDIDTVFLLTSPGPQSVAEQNGLIDRAKAAGVRKIVKISAVIAETGSNVHLADWHGQIEDHLKSSGMEYVILRPHSFMQNSMMQIPTITAQNSLYESMGDAKIPMVDTRDVARASFECLRNDTWNNKTFVITGPEAVGYQEVTNALSAATNRDIAYVQIPSDAHNAAMKQAGVPEWLADDLTQMSKDWGSEAMHQPTSDLKTITGHSGNSIRDFARDYASYFSA